MKLKNIIYPIFLVVLTSCGDFLEPKAQSEYVPKDANALQELLIGEAYPKQRAINERKILALLEIFNDDIQRQVVEGFQFRESDRVGERAYEVIYSWQPDMFDTATQLGYGVPNVWRGCYMNILGANAAIDYLSEVDGTEAEKNYVRAQALGLRAFYYYLLVNYFGAPYNYDKTALGVPLKLDSFLGDEDNFFPTRNTVEEVYNQIVNDLNEAERLFQTLPRNQQFQPDYLVSLPMVQLLKSRVYLYMENWAEAKTYAGKVIDEWSFNLLDLNTVSAPDPTNQVSYYEFTSYQSPESIWLYGNINDFTMEYMANIYAGEADNTYRKAYCASESLLSSFETGDLRKDLYIAREVNVNSNPALNEFYDTYLPFGKYKMNNSLPYSDTSFALAFRLSEAYLNFAEAAAMSNSEGEAISKMNTLLERRFTPGTFTPVSALTGDALVNKIREERRKELCFEGHRWFDLRRYGMPSFSRTWDEHTYTLRQNDASYTLPILRQVIERNNQIQQNPLAPQRVN